MQPCTLSDLWQTRGLTEVDIFTHGLTDGLTMSVGCVFASHDNLNDF